MHALIIIFGCLSLLAYSSGGLAEIYQWRDKHGQLHYSDSPNDSGEAQPATLNPTTIIMPPPPLPSPEQEVAPSDNAPPAPVASAAHWAAEHCAERTRILYTEHSFIPCVPTDEVPVYLCNKRPPGKYRKYFGREYRYEDRESECGPEVYEGEFLYLKR